jgi:hypothetical protein
MRRGPGQALQEVIDRIGRQIRPDQQVTAYLAGGMATYVHITRHAGAAPVEAVRYSDDVDIQFARPMTIEDDIVVAYRDESGQERMLALDRNYSIDLGLRHPDVFDDAPHLLNSANTRLRLHILTPLDLAVTKAGRFQDHDQVDIGLLARSGLIDSDRFRTRALEAVDYLATNPKPVLANIDDAVEMIRRIEQSP